jgi:hypothetical protein
MHILYSVTSMRLCNDKKLKDMHDPCIANKESMMFAVICNVTAGYLLSTSACRQIAALLKSVHVVFQISNTC